MRITLLVIVCLISWPVFAQHNLSGTRKSGAYTYIYRITPGQTLAFTTNSALKNNSKSRRSTAALIKKHLNQSNKTDSFLTDNSMPNLSPGNYLLVSAIKSKLHYELKTYGDLEYKIIENNHDLAVYLHTKNGDPIPDAKVQVGKKVIHYNSAGRYYLLKNTKKKGLLQVLHKNILYLADIETNKQDEYRKQPGVARLWSDIKTAFPLKYLIAFSSRRNSYNDYQTFFDNITGYETKFKGFMVFNKPIYRAGDTVRLKAFVTTKKGNPVNRQMILRLSGADFYTDTILSTIAPYTKGGYEFSFVLNDDLDLDLDEKYLLTLEETKSSKYDVNEYDGDLEEDEYAMKRKVVMRNTFEFEEYELKSITFNARTEKKKTHRGEQNFLYLKASDENGLPVLDGRVDITIEPIQNNNLRFHDESIYLKDTLFTKTINLEPMGDTRVSIPDSIFPAISLDYKITCDFLNANNESRNKTITNSFENTNEKILFELVNDSLLITINRYKTMRDANTGQDTKEVPDTNTRRESNTFITAINTRGDTILQQSIELPAKIKLNPFASIYKLSSGELQDSFELDNSSNLISCAVIRTKDSLSIELSNPHQLPAWYTIFAGKDPVQRSTVGDTIIYLESITKNNYFVSLQYVYGNRVFTKDYTVPFYDKQLQLNVDQPGFIYPGQTAEIKINLTDISGQPVKDADLTAWSYTNKFENSRDPSIPYFGKRYRNRKLINDYDEAEERNTEFIQPLNWTRWSKEMKLDAIEYYKFLHPSGIYYNHQPAPGYLTQIAPFVVSKGELQQIHFLYIDEQPVFFSRSENLSRYSFPVSDGRHSIRIRTDKALISVDSIQVVFGMKNVFSISLDSANPKVRIVKMPSKLTLQETALWSKYMILIESNYGENLAYIKQHNRIFTINKIERYFGSRSKNFMIGPLKYQYAELVVKTEFTQPFEAEGSYQYQIRKGLVKQKQLPYPLIQNTELSNGDMDNEFSDLAMTEKEIDSLWRDYLDQRSQNENLFWNRTFKGYNNARLRIAVTHDARLKEPFVRQVIVFKKDNSDFILMFKGSERDLGYFDPGEYRIFLLLKDDDYFLKEGIIIKPNGINYYTVNVNRLKRKDSLSTSIANTIDEKSLYRQFETTGDLDAIKQSFNTVYLDPKTFTRRVSGRVLDDKKTPVSGATISIKGSTFGTVSNEQGFFSLATPDQCTISIGAIGYTWIEINAASLSEIIILKPLTSALNEVVVVGYGASKKKEMTGAITQSAEMYALSGRVAGVSIRGGSTITSGNAPLIILDGLPYSGKLEDIDKSLIKDINILKGEAASLYGAAGLNGVIIITSNSTKSVEVNEQELPQSQNSIRKNFRDYAYWQPKLRTDANGSASFRTTFPDDITNWKTFVIAMADKKRTGFTTGNIRAFKTVSASLSLPAFLVVGDSINIIGKAQNYQADSIRITRVFSINDSIIQQNQFAITSSRIDTFAIGIKDADSISFTYSLQKTDGYRDGENRKLEIVKAGVLETSGMFVALDKDTSFLLANNVAAGEVTIHAEAGVLPVLLDEIEQIRSYAYFCNEQMASKLKALLQQKFIYKLLAKEFKAERDIKDLIGRITKATSSDNLWGWWKNDRSQLWISKHVLEALILAEQNGYPNSINKPAAINYLVYNLEKADSISKISSLELLHILGAKVNYQSYLDTINKYRHNLPRQSALELMALRQKAGLPIELDSVVRTSHHTMMGNIYWGNEGYYLLDNSVNNTISIYKMMRASGGYERDLAKVRNYFFEKRRDGRWRNTYESSLILEAILPDLVKEGSINSKPTLNFSGTKTAVITEFPFTQKFSPSDTIRITKSGVVPVYFTSYQQQWNSKPARVESDFTVSSAFEKNGVKLNTLTAGKAVELKVIVNVKADGDYVMIEIPIPSGCSYESKPQPYGNNEVHREYFKNKVSIFCTYLKTGSYTFTIPLMPRYTGRFNLNPAKAELMYFPVFYGREGMKKIEIR
ncbi:alpha-2-macroglobulin family protein [Flavitalea sp.]|nr:alpha-2-macroglobulin family protein [Flavitalea sp.]